LIANELQTSQRVLT